MSQTKNLPPGHAYDIYGTCEITLPNGSKDLVVKVNNPHGSEDTEWANEYYEGDYNDKMTNIWTSANL